MAIPSILRLGTRGSALARAQSQAIADLLERLHPRLKVELVPIKTTGDRVVDRPLADIGGKGLFVKEIELALLDGHIDFAVHSFKDVPVTMPLVEQANLIIAAVPTREDARDVLISGNGVSLEELPAGARVGTSSLRRRAQLLAVRPDLIVMPLRGNIDTRVAKLAAGPMDAIILAMAGLKRLQLFNEASMQPISMDFMLPAAGQGALALQCRRGDEQTHSLLKPMNDSDAEICVEAERAMVLALEGNCESPIGVFCEVAGEGDLSLQVAVGQAGGTPPVVRESAHGSRARLRSWVGSLAQNFGGPAGNYSPVA